GSHATTFGGNPLATAAALATVETLIGENLLAHCRALGEYLTERLRALARRRPAVTEVRGRGLLIGVELGGGRKAADLVRALLDRGFLVGAAGETVLRLAPPLIVEKEEVDALLSALAEVLDPA
ncbi:MAG: aminotransferase class III-fold pyridoxal phosphate-dependent enzyme, partial [Deferrisomatales bacterium]